MSKIKASSKTEQFALKCEHYFKLSREMRLAVDYFGPVDDSPEFKAALSRFITWRKRIEYRSLSAQATTPKTEPAKQWLDCDCSACGTRNQLIPETSTNFWCIKCDAKCSVDACRIDKKDINSPTPVNQATTGDQSSLNCRCSKCGALNKSIPSTSTYFWCLLCDTKCRVADCQRVPN